MAAENACPRRIPPACRRGGANLSTRWLPFGYPFSVLARPDVASRDHQDNSPQKIRSPGASAYSLLSDIVAVGHGYLEKNASVRFADPRLTTWLCRLGRVGGQGVIAQPRVAGETPAAKGPDDPRLTVVDNTAQHPVAQSNASHEVAQHGYGRCYICGSEGRTQATYGPLLTGSGAPPPRRSPATWFRPLT